MKSQPLDLSPDKLLAQATCAVLLESQIQGTAWLVSDEGHLLTAGHILGKERPAARVMIEFPDDTPREALVIQWHYDWETGVDFAVLKLVETVADRYPLPVYLAAEVTGEMRLRGYGITLKDQSPGRGMFLGFLDPQNSFSNRLFLYSSSELGERGFSGAAVFSDELNAVVALQIEATAAITGAGRDTTLAMPLYRIAERWKDLILLEKESRIRYAHFGIFNLRSMMAPLPLPPMFYHPQPPEMHWANRVSELSILTEHWAEKQVKVVGLVGLGGVGKSSLARKWCDQLSLQTLPPDGIFWWSFRYQPSLDEFLDAALYYLTGGQFKSSEVTSPWARMQQFVSFLRGGRFIIILDGLEAMQRSMESAENFGGVEDVAFRNFLGLIADPTLHRSLILITSQFPLTDLKALEGFSCRSLKVDTFSTNDGANYLEYRGVKGEKADLHSLSNEYGGHALSLSLLAGYLNEYFDGQAKHGQVIPHVATTETTKVNQILQSYSYRLTEPQKALMQLLSASRRPITHQDLESIVYNEEFNRDNPLLKSLAAFKPFELRVLVINLEKGALVSREKNEADEWTYTIHLIIREYFYAQLADNPELVTMMNLQLRDYASSLPVPDPPKRLEDLFPLYDVVFYSCQAGLFDQAAQMHRERMSMGEQGPLEIAFRFGAYEFQKSFLRLFFPDRDLTKLPLVSASDAQIFLLLEIGSCSKQLGQLAEAKSFIERAADIALNSADMLNAAIAHCELASVKARLGELNDAQEIADKAIESSKLAKTEMWEINSRAGLAWIAFLKGEIELTELAYRETRSVMNNVKMPVEIEGIGKIDDLVFDLGIQFATFLLATGRLEQSYERTEYNLKVSKALGLSEGIARCERLFGDIEFVRGNLAKALDHYIEGLEIARKFGIQEEIWRIVLGISRSLVAQSHYERAEANLTSALEIAQRSQRRIGEVDIYNGWAELCYAKRDLDRAREQAQKALEIADDTGYKWGKGTALHIQGQVAIGLHESGIAQKKLIHAYRLRRSLQDPSARLTKSLLDQFSQSINTAPQERLASLIGIGPLLATRIIEYRNTNGPFSTTDEIRNVAGIGTNKFQAIEALITVD